MKWLAIWVLMLSVAARAEEKPARRPAALVAVGEVPAALVERVQAWAQENLAVPVPVQEPRAESFENLDQAAEWAAGQLDERDLGWVVLLEPTGDATAHGMTRPDLRVSVVNVKAMRADNPDEETFARRMERQVMRGLGFLYGLEPSPNPQSAMTSYSSLAELDEIGRNFDPPWTRRFQELARDHGVPVDPESPYYLLP